MSEYTNSTGKIKKTALVLLLYVLLFGKSLGQILPLKEAINRGITNYGVLKAKSKYALAANETVELVKKDYLPNVNLSVQQDYGTVNGQNGPLYGLGGLGVASSGLALPSQNWNAAFGALYLANVNWEVYNFGRTKQKIEVAKSDANRLQKDYEQELFHHEIKISAAYLNLLASQRLLISEQKNLERSEVFYRNVSTRAKNGLLPGVDSTTAAAEMSSAKIRINRLKEQVKVQNNELAQLIGEELWNISTDTTFISHIPQSLSTAPMDTNNFTHPVKEYFQSRIALSYQQENLLRKEYLPSFNMFGVLQTRASGFNSNYSTDQTSFSHSYFDGIIPTRQNYLIGIGAVWNLTSIVRSYYKIGSQKFITQGLEEEYKTIDLELRSRENTADARIDYALQNFNEAPLQVRAAQRAYTQRLALYNNGLSTLTDVTTAQYILNRAETDRDIAFTNVWQALLMKAAATGNFNLFLNEF